MVSKIDYHITPNETNVIKGIAICAMFWHHLFLGYREYGEMTFKLALTSKVCVALFVFLSGYGMAAQYKKRRASSINTGYKRHALNGLLFLLRRYAKFYMNYWVIFFIMMPLGMFVFGRSLTEAYGTESSIWTHFLSDFLGVAGFESYNITWWFNRLILSLWLLFPFLYWAMSRKVVSFWVLLLLYFNPGLIVGIFDFFCMELDNYMLTFTLGIFLAVNEHNVNDVLNKINHHIVLILTVVLTLVFLYMRNHYVFSCFLMTKGDPFIAAFLSLAVVSLCRLLNRNMNILVFIGKHSMNMYLTHTFIFSYFFHDFIYSFKYPISIFSVLLIVSLLLSIAIEFLKKKIGFYQFQKSVISNF